MKTTAQLIAEIEQLKKDNLKLTNRIYECRHYLMGVHPKDLTVGRVLEELGFDQIGLNFNP